MMITRNAYDKILRFFLAPIPEKGGLLGGQNGVINEFEPDSTNCCTHMNQYSPDVGKLNNILEQWFADKIEFYGIIHSHPKGQDTLSGSDIVYITDILNSMPPNITFLYFPLAIGGTDITAFKANINGSNVNITIEPIDIIE